MKRIKIYVEGGVVQDVIFEVIDYDKKRSKK